jgi:glycosyltransferase involved in cell wall biosynthesis
LIISGNPYIQFKFAYNLNKKYGVRWIADYRDAWTNSKINHISRNTIFNLLNSYDSIFEKKWVHTASYITSVSDKLVKQIGSFVKVKGESIYNGFVNEDFDNFRNEKPFKKFTITYVGTLFPGQKLEVFLEAFKKYIDANGKPETKLLLPGLAFKKEQKEMVEKVMSGYEEYYECSERIDREEVLKTEVKSHLLLYVAWEGFSGIVPSKIYEYIASGSYILVAPSDKDAVDEIVRRSGCGVSLSSQDEIISLLNDLYSKYLNGIKVTNDTNTENVKQFSRKLQVEKLKNILNNI